VTINENIWQLGSIVLTQGTRLHRPAALYT